VRATIEGRVQGVGFRPAIYRHAVACGLKGFVRNDAGGVTLEVEGRRDGLKAFFDRLEESLPQQAVVARVVTELPPRLQRLRVVASESEGRERQLPPDLATCPACEELGDPRDRHYHSVHQLVDCGPRFDHRDLPTTGPYLHGRV
jgi:hydrogenase maturation protein HypF